MILSVFVPTIETREELYFQVFQLFLKLFVFLAKLATTKNHLTGLSDIS